MQIKKYIGRILITAIFTVILCFAPDTLTRGQFPGHRQIKFIDYFYENGSPVNWAVEGDSLLKVSLIPDYERESLNRQTDHWNFRIIADSGTRIRLIISKMQPDIYNGRLSTNWWNFDHDISCYISYDRKSWEPLKTSRLPGHKLLVDFRMTRDRVYVARLPVYTISDLEDLEARYRGNALFKIFNIGHTIENRPLEIIRLGKPDAPYSVIIRARAHSWEPGGNWVIEGLIKKFLDVNSGELKETFCVYIMPMANKDGVARGMTRFNTAGMDLNRKWDQMSDPGLCPEKYALEKFLAELTGEGIIPSLGIDIHNDDAGGIDPATHRKNDTVFIKKMELFEKLMRKYTLFSEKVNYSWESSGHPEPFILFENGLYRRYGIEAMVWELNANWIAGQGKIPTQDDWIKTGEDLNEVFYRFLTGKAE